MDSLSNDKYAKPSDDDLGNPKEMKSEKGEKSLGDKKSASGKKQAGDKNKGSK